MDDKKQTAKQVRDLIDLKLNQLLTKNKKVDIHVSNLKDLAIPRPIVNTPSEVSVKRPVWMAELANKIAESVSPDKEPDKELMYIVDTFSKTKTYIGHAEVGSEESNSVWRIKRITKEDKQYKCEYADGNANFDNLWSKRDFLDYL